MSDFFFFYRNSIFDDVRYRHAITAVLGLLVKSESKLTKEKAEKCLLYVSKTRPVNKMLLC